MIYTEFENAVTNSLDITRTDAQADGNLGKLFNSGLSVDECLIYFL